MENSKKQITNKKNSPTIGYNDYTEYITKGDESCNVIMGSTSKGLTLGYKSHSIAIGSNSNSKTNGDNAWRVYLKAGNGRTIVKSNFLDAEEEAENVIEDLKCLSPETPIVDKTK